MIEVARWIIISLCAMLGCIIAALFIVPIFY